MINWLKPLEWIERTIDDNTEWVTNSFLEDSTGINFEWSIYPFVYQNKIKYHLDRSSSELIRKIGGDPISDSVDEAKKFIEDIENHWKNDRELHSCDLFNDNQMEQMHELISKYFGVYTTNKAIEEFMLELEKIHD